MGATQMNIRIEDEVKALGDQVLSEIGYTPTQAVRTLWEFAAANRGNPEALRRQLDEMAAMDLESEVRWERRRRAFSQADEPAQEFLATLGWDELPAYREVPYDELRAQALVGRMEEKGLW